MRSSAASPGSVSNSWADRIIPARRFVALLLLTPAVLLAAEVDSFTSRRVPLPDAVTDINHIVNQRLRQGVEQANASRVVVEMFEGIELTTEKPFCDQDDLYTALRTSIFQSSLSWGLKGYDLDKQLREQLADKSYSLSLRDSVYRDIDYLEGISLRLKELTDVVNVDGHIIGLDKLGHFFAEGWRYHEIVSDEEGDLQQAMAWGLKKEQGLFGYTTTGILSYADLVANFQGWRFWNRVELTRPDPLLDWVAQLFDRAYVSCDIKIIESLRQWRLVRAWSVNRHFDLRDYIDPSWDEGINCNSYADPVIEHKVRSRIAEIDDAYSCPIHAAACQSAQQRYGDYARQLLHPHCLIAD